MPGTRPGTADADGSQDLESKEQRKLRAKTKKEQGDKPRSKNCVDPISPKDWI
jgi:hypothetical protein